MNKKQCIITIMLASVGLAAHACPIKVKNDTNVPVYVVGTVLADKLTDVATGQQIKKMAEEMGIKKRDYEKIRVGETDMIGNGKSKTYFFYVRAGSSKQYIRLHQLQFSSCIPLKQKKRFWKKMLSRYRN